MEINTNQPLFHHDEVALLSIDNTQWFENKSLNELYVNEWEQAAESTKKVVDLCKIYWIKLINIFDNHPLGHVLFAANYQNKNPYDTISFEEIKNRTNENNWIWARATFTLAELKDYLQTFWPQVLWPDHCIQWTQWASPMAPLKEYEFDIHIPKWEKVVNSWYSAFDNTWLDKVLKSNNIKNLLITGVATDYCVWQTALDAKKLWFNPIIISEAVRWVAPETTDNMLKTFNIENIKVITISELTKILE